MHETKDSQARIHEHAQYMRRIYWSIDKNITHKETTRTCQDAILDQMSLDWCECVFDLLVPMVGQWGHAMTLGVALKLFTGHSRANLLGVNCFDCWVGS